MTLLRFVFILFLLSLANSSHAEESSHPSKHVILISIDGLRSDAIKALGQKRASAFYQMIREGASTFNARTDDDMTVTIPNHTSMITGYPVLGKNGHHVTINTDSSQSVHDYARRHIESLFDVLHENHRQSAMLASKLKFDIYQKSYPIDFVSLTDQNDLKTLQAFKKVAQVKLPDFIFMHFAGADRVGHQKGWDISPGSFYLNELEILNGYLDSILKVILLNEDLKNSTLVILTTDHGGEGTNHADESNPHNYTIPFFVWGYSVSRGGDLYKINSDHRQDPKTKRIQYSNPRQPIRNSDAANLAAKFLGLPVITGSTMSNTYPMKTKEDQSELKK